MEILYGKTWIINKETGERDISAFADLEINDIDEVINDEEMNKFIRECKKLWDSGDIEGFRALK